MEDSESCTQPLATSGGLHQYRRVQSAIGTSITWVHVTCIAPRNRPISPPIWPLQRLGITLGMPELMRQEPFQYFNRHFIHSLIGTQWLKDNPPATQSWNNFGSVHQRLARSRQHPGPPAQDMTAVARGRVQQ